MNFMPQPRFISVTTSDNKTSAIEVLEVFSILKKARVFNLRLRRGFWAPNEDIANALRKEFKISPEFIWTAAPMAGDLTFSFDPAVEGVPDNSSSVTKSDNFGVTPRPADLAVVPEERWIDGGQKRKSKK